MRTEEIAMARNPYAPRALPLLFVAQCPSCGDEVPVRKLAPGEQEGERYCKKCAAAERRGRKKLRR